MEKYHAVSLPVFTLWKDYQSLGTRFVPLLLFVWMGFKDHLTRNSLSCITENSGMLKLLYRNNRQSFCAGVSFCAPASVAGESRHIHIPSSPHQRREPRLPPRLWQGAGVTRAAGFLRPPHPSASFQGEWECPRGCKWTQPPCPALLAGAGLGTNTRCWGWKWGGSLSTLHRCG